MQDIPRHELLEKIAAGWKVRRYKWPKEHTISKNGGSVSISYVELLEDDWEGKSPQPMCVYCELTIHSAFRYLREDKFNLQFIRRKSWPCTIFLKDDGAVELLVSDIVAEDWEVWG